MKTDTVYKRAFNRTVELLADTDIGTPLPSENEIKRSIEVSRTTVRKVLRELDRRSIITGDGAARVTVRKTTKDDCFPEAETMPRTQHVEQHFMEWMLHRDTRPGTLINELELARQYGVATSGIREFLIRFSRFGLIEKRANSGWLFKGFTEEFALELFEIRMMFELRSARLFSTLPLDSELWGRLDMLMQAHRELLVDIEMRFHDFSALDNSFHRLVNEAAPNRFINDFYDVIAFIFHYHYQWNKKDELQRNKAAVLEHIAYIEALQSRDEKKIEAACLKHLGSARETLLQSLIGIDEN